MILNISFLMISKEKLKFQEQNIFKINLNKQLLNLK